MAAIDIHFQYGILFTQDNVIYGVSFDFIVSYSHPAKKLEAKIGGLSKVNMLLVGSIVI